MEALNHLVKAAILKDILGHVLLLANTNSCCLLEKLAVIAVPNVEDGGTIEAIADCISTSLNLA